METIGRLRSLEVLGSGTFGFKVWGLGVWDFGL